MLHCMEPLTRDYLERFAAAVVQEIWTEMGRQRITSLRELARLAGMTHTAVIVRMNGDSRTGKQVVINVKDLAALGEALGVEPGRLIDRAQDAMNVETDPISLDKKLATKRTTNRRSAMQQVEDQAARDES